MQSDRDGAMALCIRIQAELHFPINFCLPWQFYPISFFQEFFVWSETRSRGTMSFSSYYFIAIPLCHSDFHSNEYLTIDSKPYLILSNSKTDFLCKVIHFFQKDK